ncbi:MAG: 4Fe-4S binding protein [archaeon]
MTKMKLYKINKLTCAGCGACIRVCPNHAIKIEKDGRANIDQKKCGKCGLCKKACPFDSILEKVL